MHKFSYNATAKHFEMTCTRNPRRSEQMIEAHLTAEVVSHIRPIPNILEPLSSTTFFHGLAAQLRIRAMRLSNAIDFRNGEAERVDGSYRARLRFELTSLSPHLSRPRLTITVEFPGSSDPEDMNYSIFPRLLADRTWTGDLDDYDALSKLAEEAIMAEGKLIQSISTARSAKK